MGASLSCLNPRPTADLETALCMARGIRTEEEERSGRVEEDWVWRNNVDLWLQNPDT